jgi:RNA polymerase sigma-70 factor (ECF subfamily)
MPDDSNACSPIQALDRTTDDKLLSFIQEAEEHRNYLTWVAGRVTTSTEEAEDIVQHALLKAFVNLSRFRGDAKMRTWLHAIVLNTAREQLRNQKRRVRLQQVGLYDGEDEDKLCDLPHPGLNPEELCEQSEVAAILHAEIRMLTPICKQTLEMCVVSDLPHQAIAKVLGTNVATVKSRVHRAKAMLRSAMKLRMQPRNGMDELEGLSVKKRAGRHDWDQDKCRRKTIYCASRISETPFRSG